MPSIMVVTLEQHKLMAELGIKERTDGKFGFKLKCQVCDKPQYDNCFCSDTLEDAIATVKTKKSPYNCSQECWRKDSRAWDGIEDFVVESIEGEELYERVAIVVRHEDDNTYFPSGWLKILRETDPILYREVQDLHSDSQDYDYDPYDGDGFEECDCELD